MKMIPTSADDLQPSELWPLPLQTRPGRKKRRRLEKKHEREKFDIDPELPSFPQVTKSNDPRCCSLCGEPGHYAGTCRKPSSLKVIQGSCFIKTGPSGIG